MLTDGEKGVVIQKDQKSYAVLIHFPCGQITGHDFKTLATAAETLHIPQIKLTSSNRIALIGMTEAMVDKLWKDFPFKQGQIIGRTGRYAKACPGSQWCRLGKRETMGMGLKLDKKYHGQSFPGKIKIGISGCANQCAENCIKDIALMATQKGWRLQVGGNGGGRPRLAKELARGLSDQSALALIGAVLDYYKLRAKKNQRLGAFIEKEGWEEFCRSVLS